MLCACFIKTVPGYTGYRVLVKCGDPSLTGGGSLLTPDTWTAISGAECCCGSGLVARLGMHGGHVIVAFN